jgi:hypothetical protein
MTARKEGGRKEVERKKVAGRNRDELPTSA